MKVLQINCVYRKGSTGKITADIHEELLRQGVESVVCYGRGEKISEPHVYKTCGELESKVHHAVTRVNGLMYGGLFAATRRLIRIIESEQPDIVHLQCINGYFVNIYELITWLKQNHIKTVVTLHAEFMYTGNCGYALDCDRWLTGCGQCSRLREETESLFRDCTHESWQRMKESFAGFEQDCIITSVSPWLMERAKQSPILSSFLHRTVLNGINTQIFHPWDTAELRKHNGSSKDTPIVFHATAHFSTDPSHIKGGFWLVHLAKRMPDVQFFVAGSHDENMILPENVTLLGRLADQTTLAKYYSMADVTLLVSKKETFSMIVAESICCGTPVVGFQAGGPESIALPEYSTFVEQGDLEGMEREVRKALNASYDRSEIAAAGHDAYCVAAMCAGYQHIYDELLSQKDKG